MRASFAAPSPASSRSMSRASSSRASGAGSTSLPPMYMIFPGQASPNRVKSR